jgi:hypothetical protein
VKLITYRNDTRVFFFSIMTSDIQHMQEYIGVKTVAEWGMQNLAKKLLMAT